MVAIVSRCEAVLIGGWEGSLLLMWRCFHFLRFFEDGIWF